MVYLPVDSHPSRCKLGLAWSNFIGRTQLSILQQVFGYKEFYAGPQSCHFFGCCNQPVWWGRQYI